jgi:hypothetical protein
MSRLLVTGCALAAVVAAACTEDDGTGGAGGTAGSSAGMAGEGRGGAAMAGFAGAGAGRDGLGGGGAGSDGTGGSYAGAAGLGAGDPGAGGSAGGSGTGGHAGDSDTGGGAGDSGGGGSAGDSDIGGSAGDSGAGASGGNGEERRWAACPSADEFSDDASWPDTLEVTGTGVYCATFDETRTLKEELAKKALLRITPGIYRLPAADQEGLSLPVCIAFGEQGAGVPAVPRRTTHRANDGGTGVSHRYGFVSEQPEPARRLTIDLGLNLPDGEAPGFVLNGDAPDVFGPTEPLSSFALYQSLQGSLLDRGFDSCTHESSSLNRHEIVLEDGELVLDVRIGQWVSSTEPAAFVAASGTFRGVAFEQTNYFKLVYRPAHHHFERDFAVLFEEPIDGACGVKIEAFPSYPTGIDPTAATVDCALDPIDALTVRSFTLTRDPP